MTAAGGVVGGHAHQTVHAALAFQVAVGVEAVDAQGGAFDAAFVSRQLVQQLHLEAPALRPAGVHALEHAGPVLGLQAAGAGVQGEDGVVGVVFAGQQLGQLQGIQLLDEAAGGGLRLGGEVLVIFFQGQFHGGLRLVGQGLGILVGLDHLAAAVDLAHQLLGGVSVIPEIRRHGLFLHGGDVGQLPFDVKETSLRRTDVLWRRQAGGVILLTWLPPHRAVIEPRPAAAAILVFSFMRQPFRAFQGIQS